MDKRINEFLDYLLYQKNYSEYTKKNYGVDLLLFKEYLNKENLDYLSIDYQDIRLFFNFLDEKRYSKSSINRKLSSIRSFYNFLAKNNYVTTNPFKLVKAPKKDKKLPKFLYYNELETLFNIPNLNTPLGIRDKLILELLYATGMRVGELEYIELKDVDLNEKTIKVLGKGNKERLTLFGNYAFEALKLYLNKSRNFLVKNDNKYLLLNNRGNRLTARGIRLIVNRIVDKSSIDTKISPHVLRHTFATHLLNAGCDIISVQELLGHESLRATQVYTHITNDGLRNIYLNTHPRNNKKID